MIQFEGGGRMMADFTDCEQDALEVGLPVRMAFRKHATDRERGFTGYFWKAVPLLEEARREKEERARAAAEIRFDGQVAIVTGGGGGLGRAYALELGRRGAKVVVNDLGGGPDGRGESRGPADRVVKEIEEQGGVAIASYASVTTAEGGEAIVRAAVEKWGRVDILINNAGILRDKTFGKMSEEMWEAVRAVHLDGAWHVTGPAFRVMKERGYGRIVLTTSAAGLYGNYGQANYSAAKMGVVGLMNTLKLEGEKSGIKVNTVAPLAATRLTEAVLPEEMKGKLRPEAVAPLVIVLCSEKCKASGLILNAGMGHYSRAAVVEGRGVRLGEADGGVTPEDVQRNWAMIHSIDGAQEYGDANAALGGVLG
jgi:NAD(P)-dependent dehydrogenase (short-subunit alcohol dehydrogenase family)